MTTAQLIHGDCLEIMRSMASDSVNLTFCSPPYETARTYGIGFNLKGQAWVDWCVERFVECVRVTRGMVCWVVEGQTRKFRYSAAPLLFMADLHRAGVHLRKPPIYFRRGIPGSGGPDWWANCYEFVICGSKGGELAWSDNTATGNPPKFGPGGVPSHRLTNGVRANVERMQRLKATGLSQRESARQSGVPFKIGTSGTDDAGTCTLATYIPPEIANPGNVIACDCGGGKMGDHRAHENEAPFPEELAEPFIRSFCPEGGTVFDPFCGSGTTIAVALKFNRNAIGVDIRESQVALTKRRIAEVQKQFA